MAHNAASYRQLADQAQAQADAAILDNVRERNARAAAAFREMAERQERVAVGRTDRTPSIVS